jgi:hypothetical protein
MVSGYLGTVTLRHRNLGYGRTLDGCAPVSVTENHGELRVQGLQRPYARHAPSSFGLRSCDTSTPKLITDDEGATSAASSAIAVRPRVRGVLAIPGILPTQQRLALVGPGEVRFVGE